MDQAAQKRNNVLEFPPRCNREEATLRRCHYRDVLEIPTIASTRRFSQTQGFLDGRSSRCTFLLHSHAAGGGAPRFATLRSTFFHFLLLTDPFPDKRASLLPPQLQRLFRETSRHVFLFFTCQNWVFTKKENNGERFMQERVLGGGTWQE